MGYRSNGKRDNYKLLNGTKSSEKGELRNGHDLRTGGIE